MVCFKQHLDYERHHYTLENFLRRIDAPPGFPRDRILIDFRGHKDYEEVAEAIQWLKWNGDNRRYLDLLSTEEVIFYTEEHDYHWTDRSTVIGPYIDFVDSFNPPRGLYVSMENNWGEITPAGIRVQLLKDLYDVRVSHLYGEVAAISIRINKETFRVTTSHVTSP